ncbi:Bacteriophage holin family protein [Dyadobacter soli]|uniref:Bacteriophage holin family protein n=1 Tax=Dyadobacter soli TaxID=659014 RepID=A0A1G7WJF8_9BACT|nr:phage holin family protein [Dyadobacter soli]SDG72131.1 Bacteriophage holin family protein [Dyadobacter soli]
MIHHLTFISEHFFTVTIWALVAGIGAWLLEFVETYVFSDFKYLVYLLLMIAYDAYSGIQKQKYLNKQDPANYPPVTAKVFKDKTFSKLMYYVCVLSSLHGLAHLQIDGIEVTIFHAVEYSAMLTIMATEFWSVQENYAAIGKKTILQLAWDNLKAYIPSKKSPDGN